MSPRQQAIAAGEKHYHGSPCKRCRNTRRDVRSSHCMECESARQRRLYEDLTGPQYNRLLLRRRRVKALRRMRQRQEAGYGSLPA